MSTQSAPMKKQWPQIFQIKSLTKKLSLDLSKTANCVESFCLQQAMDFENISKLADARSPLLPIRMTLKDLEAMDRSLKALADKCDDLAQNVRFSAGTRPTTVNLCVLRADWLISLNSLKFD